MTQKQVDVSTQLRIKINDSSIDRRGQNNGKNAAIFVSPDTAPSTQLIPASEFTFEELVAAYNQTRVDYIVPMPMNAARLREYVHNYDVDMDASAVARFNSQTLGLAMLGVRPGHTWITRLGVLPVKRRHGTGELLMRQLIAQSQRLGVEFTLLEVIQNNTPAQRLFKKLGFRETRELMVIRRPPGSPVTDIEPYKVEKLDGDEALALLNRRRSIPSWLDSMPSLINAGNLAALRVELKTGGWGWLIYQDSVFQLGHLVFQTESGDPYHVARALLHALHTGYPIADTKSENLPADDPHWLALKDFNYLKAFVRVEMRLDL